MIQDHRYQIIIPIMLFLFSLLIRLYYFSFETCLSNADSIAHLKQAEILVGNIDENYPVPYYAPFYSVMIAIFSNLFNNFETSGMMVSIVFSALMIVSTFYLGKTLFDRRVGIISSLLTIIFPFTLTYSTMVLSESLYWFLFITGLVIGFLAINKGEIRYFILTGLLFGLSYLTRTEGLGLLFLFPVIIILYKLVYQKERSSRSLIFQVLSFFLTFLIVSTPYFISLYQLGEGFLIRPSLTFRTYVIQMPDYVKSEYFVPGLSEKSGLFFSITSGLGFIQYVLHYANSIKEAFLVLLPSMFPKIWLIPIFGLFGSLLIKDNYYHASSKNNYYLLFFFIFTILAVNIQVNNNVVVRMYLSIIPIVMIWLTIGIFFASSKIENRLIKNIKNKFINKILTSNNMVLLFVIIIVVSFTPRLLTPVFADGYSKPIEHRNMGYWIKENISEKCVILDESPFVAYYSENYRLDISNNIGSIKDLLEYAKNKKADYLVIDKRLFAAQNPNLSWLLNPKKVSAEDLKFIHKINDKMKYPIFLYKVLYPDKI